MCMYTYVHFGSKKRCQVMTESGRSGRSGRGCNGGDDTFLMGVMGQRDKDLEIFKMRFGFERGSFIHAYIQCTKTKTLDVVGD